MNFLAHAYLSFDDEDLLTGNMISDFVKGKAKYDFTLGILKGIELHRAIDDFTDTHTATKAANVLLKPVVGLYAGVFTDVIYDHFLSLDRQIFRTENVLQTFSAGVYKTLEKNRTVLPPRFAALFPYMQREDWLANYGTMKLMERSFNGIFRRAKFITYTPEVFAIFQKEYHVLQECYEIFIPEVKSFALARVTTM